MLTFIGEWLARDPRLKTSIAGQIGHPAYGIQQLRDDLDRILSEALIEDLRVNAPQVRVAVVMPGHVDTDIVANSFHARGLPTPEQMSDAQVEELIRRDAQAELIRAGLLAEGASAADLRRMLVQANADFRDKAPVSAAEAAAIILYGSAIGGLGILVGEDAKRLDTQVRAKPEAAYDYAELFSGWQKSRRRERPERWQPAARRRGTGPREPHPAGRTALSQTRVTARDVHWRGAPARRMIVRQYHL